MTALISTIKQIFSFKLLLLYLSLCALILLITYFNLDGCLSPDSTSYLELSKNLMAGNGFRIADYTTSDGKSFFAIWPAGYPVLIFFMSKMTGLGIVWASKVLNLLIIGIILLLFRYIFKENAHWVGLIFFVDSAITVFSYTWTEGPFVLFLLLTCISLYKCVETNGKILWLTGLLFSGIGLFLMRYLGLFSVSIIGLIALINLYKHNWHLSVKLLMVSLFQLIFAGLYLYHNILSTGFLTGMQRDLPSESNLELLKQLLSALKEELILVNGFPLLFNLGLFLLLGIYLFWSKGKIHSKEKKNDLWKYFFLAGILYLGAITGAKWFSNFTALDYRYLFPGSFFLLLSLSLYLQGKPSVKLMKSPVVYLLILVVFFIYYMPYTKYVFTNISKEINYFQNPNYIDNTKEILEKYKDVMPGSIVINGPIHLRYLRDDIIPTEIYNKASLEEMIEKFTRKRDWNVYVNIKDDLDPAFTHESLIQFSKTNFNKQVVKVH